MRCLRGTGLRVQGFSRVYTCIALNLSILRGGWQSSLTVKDSGLKG